MSKLLRVRDYVLMTAATAGEFLEDVRLVGDLIPKMMEIRYGFVPPNYKRASYFSSVSKLLSTGEIKRKTDSKGNVFLELTARGESKFKRKFPILSLQKGEWDETFMIVVFDISEKERKKRDTLRRKLRELGFGMMQESVWISPYHFEDDFREFLETRDLASEVFVLRAQALMMGDYKKLAEKIWNLQDINLAYKGILENIDAESRKKLWERYFETVNSDPMLPIELLPGDWTRSRVFSKLQKLALTKH